MSYAFNHFKQAMAKYTNKEYVPTSLLKMYTTVIHVVRQMHEGANPPAGGDMTIAVLN